MIIEVVRVTAKWPQHQPSDGHFSVRVATTSTAITPTAAATTTAATTDATTAAATTNEACVRSR